MAMTWGTPELGRIQDLCRLYLRPCSLADTDGGVVLVFDPPLTTDEQATLAVIERMARSHVTGLSLAEFRALDPTLAELRDLRTRTPAEWQAMTAAQRDNALIQWCQDLTDVLRALLRD